MLCGVAQDYGRLFWVPLGERPTPDAIAFDAQIGVAPGALATSNAVVVSGFSGSAPISITGGEYSVNGAAFTALAGTIAAGQSLQVRTNAPAGATNAPPGTTNAALAPSAPTNAAAATNAPSPAASTNAPGKTNAPPKP